MAGSSPALLVESVASDECLADVRLPRLCRESQRRVFVARLQVRADQAFRNAVRLIQVRTFATHAPRVRDADQAAQRIDDAGGGQSFIDAQLSQIQSK